MIDAFFQAVQQDETLRQELEASPSEDAFFLTAVRRGAERGLIFTSDEVRQASTAGQVHTELSDTTLAKISGGMMQEVTSWRFCTWTWLGC
jgi:predicted ribosomally synthesized peptide with nif11-like leader